MLHVYLLFYVINKRHIFLDFFACFAYNLFIIDENVLKK